METKHTEDDLIIDTPYGRKRWGVIRKALDAHDALLAALEECITENGAHCMVDESRNAASKCRDRLCEIRRVARAAIAAAKGGEA